MGAPLVIAFDTAGRKHQFKSTLGIINTRFRTSKPTELSNTPNPNPFEERLPRS
jgi:hypothetical protein